MNITLVVTEDCNTCKRVEAQMKQLSFGQESLNLIIKNINDFKKRGIVIVPALFIEDELFCYGDVDEIKLLSKVAKLQN